jgi:FlaA1/EpsC-like NDP-sugar epimerase
MTRYFMTIPEAVQLVIRSGSLAGGGEVFVLEMGEPVRIMDLARDMIRLSGLEPERDIAIEIVGPRPGEKLHEELFNPYERPQPTPAQKILRAAQPRLDPDWERETFDQVNWLVLDGDAAALAAKVGELAAVRQVPPVLDAGAAVRAELPGSRDGA